MRRIALILTTCALIAAACSTSESDSDDGLAGDDASTSETGNAEASNDDPLSVSTTGPAGTEPEAADGQAGLTVGVTDESVKLVILAADAGSVGGLGIDTSTDITMAEAAEALVGPVNAAGGVHGRMIDVEIVEFVPLDVDAQRAACLEATEDRGAFAVINTQAYFGDPVLCLVERQQTIFMEGDGFTPDFYERADGRLFSTVPSKHRAMAVAARYADAAGLLDGATIGIVGTGDISGAQAVDDVLVPTIEELGHEVADIARLSSDAGEMPPQVPPAVEAMRSAGADTVFLVHNVLANSQFVTEAEAVGWTPQWITTDAAQGVSDLTIALMPPDAYDGAVGYTSTLAGAIEAGEPETEANAACRERIESGTGVTLTRVSDDGGELPSYTSWMILCNLVDSFVAGLQGAGEQLDQSAFIEALERAGDLPIANHGGTGSYGPDKHDLPDSFRAVHYEARCDCWVPDGEFESVE